MNTLKIKTTTKTVRHCNLQLTSKDIVGLLQRAGYCVPDSATVVFDVPGGADWSNTTIDISAEHPIGVNWSDTKQNVSEA